MNIESKTLLLSFFGAVTILPLATGAYLFFNSQSPEVMNPALTDPMALDVQRANQNLSAPIVITEQAKQAASQNQQNQAGQQPMDMQSSLEAQLALIEESQNNPPASGGTEQNYVKALDDLKTKPAALPKPDVDRLNKVVVDEATVASNNSDQQAMQQAIQLIMSLQEKVDSLEKMLKQEAATSNVALQSGSKVQQTTSPKQMSDAALVGALRMEADKHSNEMRLIRVRPGDSLWTIAKRAYGTGNSYDLLIQANPEIADNPDAINPGMLLRVPL